SIRKAAKEYKLACFTLRRYIAKNINIKNEELQNISLIPNYDVNKICTTEQEKTLKEYVKECALTFYDLSTVDCRRIAYQMATINNIKVSDNWIREEMTGYEWLRSFRSRHPDLSLKPLPSFGNCCRIYNLDETATTTIQRPKKVLAPNGVRNIGKVTSGEKGILVTKALIIHAVLLIMDNHKSHLSIEALNLAKQFRITMLTLHPHMTAKLQPLDVGLLAPFKIFYNATVESWLLRNPGKTFTIYNIADCVGTVYMKSMTPVNVIQAFKKCGIFPFNPNVFTENNFLPSTVTDRSEPEVMDLTADININLKSESEISDDIDNSNRQSSGINRNFKSPKNFLPPLKAGLGDNK
ncbi:hypothetical protein ALC62_14275, partial [Cyphomyrmex costatus]